MDNLYHFDDTVEIDVDRPTYIGAGIKEDIFLKRVEYGSTDKGNEFLAFYFENVQGDKLSHTEWPPRPSTSFDDLSAEDKENFLKKVKNQKNRIKQIIKTYLPKEKFDLKPESFKEYAEDIIKLLKGKIEDVPIRVKIVFNEKGFTTLPKYSKYKFIELMTVPKELSKIQPMDIDIFVRPTSVTPNVKSTSNTLEINTEEEVTDIKSNLPF